MDKQNYLVTIASFMIFLILTIPIYSSSVMAASINSVQVYGNDKVVGYRAKTDITVVNVSATVPEDSDLSTSQVKILSSPTIPFQCTLVDAPAHLFECIYEAAEQTLSSSVSVSSFNVQLFDDAGVAMSAVKPASVTVDSNPPSIEGEVSYTSLPGGIVEARYSIVDTACDSALCTGKCAGVASVEFTVAGYSVGSEVFDDTFCTVEGAANLSGLAVSGAVQEKHICVEAVDKFGQSSTECGDVTVDAKPPEVTKIGIYDSNDDPVNYTNGQPINYAKLKIEIAEDSGLFNPVTGAVNNIHVDASSLSERSDYQEAYKDLDLSCTESSEDENVYECSYPGLFVIASTARTISVRVEAKDGFGITLNSTESVPLGFDNTPPVATRIYTDLPDDKGNYWVREDNNTVMLSITESGAGMYNRNVFMDFSGFGSQDVSEGGSVSSLYPNECVPSWICKWKYIVTNQPSNTLLYPRLTTGSRDDANNELQPVSGSLRVDKDAPEVMREYSNITGIGESLNPMTNLTSGAVLDIRIFVEDLSGIKSAFANLSEVVENGPESAPGECAESDIILNPDKRVYECKWETSAIKQGPLDDLSISFAFEDYTDHKLNYEWDGIEILALEDATKSRWRMRVVSASPENGIDRMSWALGAHRIYYNVKIEDISGQVSGVVSINFDPFSCSGLDWVNRDTQTGEFIIQRYGYADFSESYASNDIIAIELNPGAVPEYYTVDGKGNEIVVDKVSVNCSFIFTSIVGRASSSDGRSLSLPETVNITFDIPVYNNPLKTNIGNIQDEIDELEESVTSGIQKFLYYARYVLTFAREICRVIEMLVTLSSIIAGVKDMLGTACNTPAASAACPASAAMGETKEVLDSGINKILKESYYFCGLFISCRLSANARESMEADCSNSAESGWCQVKKLWATYNSWYAEYVGLQFLQTKGPLSMGQVQTDTTIVEGQEQKVTEGLTLFSTDDFDPSKSIVSSVLTGCIPGVINNFEKLRQIKCKKLLCLKIDVPLGRPKWQCDAQYSNDLCNFWFGQVMSAIPLAQYVEQIGGLIQDFAKNPVSLVLGLAISQVCRHLCRVENAVGCTACTIVSYATTIIALGKDLVENTGARWDSISFDLCEEAVKDDPSYENINWPGVEKSDEEEEGNEE